jgi:hypothetical protein
MFPADASSVDVRGNKPTDPEWVKTLTPAGGGGWRLQHLTQASARRGPCGGGWTDIFRDLGPAPRPARFRRRRPGMGQMIEISISRR